MATNNYPCGSLKEEIDEWKVKVKHETITSDDGSNQNNLDHESHDCTSATGANLDELRDIASRQCPAGNGWPSMRTVDCAGKAAKSAGGSGTVSERGSGKAGKQVLGTQLGAALQRVAFKRKPNANQEPMKGLTSSTIGRRKSFSGWLSHKRPSAKQQMRNSHLDVTRKTSGPERIQIADVRNPLLYLK